MQILRDFFKNCTFFPRFFLDHCDLIGKINISNSSSTNKIWKGESAAALLRLKKMFVWNSQRWFTDLLITFLAPRCEDEDERHLTELWRDYGAAAGLAPTKNFGFMPCPRGIPCFSSKRIMGQNYTYVVREGHSSEKKGFLLNLIL